MSELIIKQKHEDGNTVLDENGNPVMVTKTRTVQKDVVVIEDCKHLNTSLIERALYGAVQKLIEKVEALEARVSALEG